MTQSQKFFREKAEKIFKEKSSILDIAGGLRIDRARGNIFDPKNAWLVPLSEKVDYKIMDYVPDYSPDIVGDVQNIPLEDNSQDAIFCIGVLNCVKDPTAAIKEIHRVLKPGGYAFIYFSFLRIFAPYPGYYRDYWRFTEDAVDFLMEPFSVVEKCRIRGAIETLFSLTPAGYNKYLSGLARLLDKIFGKNKSRQTSGYHVFAEK